MVDARVRVVALTIAAGLLGVLVGCSGGGSGSSAALDASAAVSEEGMMDAAVQGDVQQLKKLTEADPALLQARGDLGWTPLHAAAVKGHEAAVKFLLEQGADPLAKDGSGRSAEELATLGGYTSIAKALADAAQEDGPQGEAPAS